MSLEEVKEEIEKINKKLEREKTVTKSIISTKDSLRHYKGLESGAVRRFEEDCRDALRVNGKTGEAAADYIYSKLDGEAKEELKLRDSATRKDVEAIFTALRDAYGDTRSLSFYRQLFYGRKQKSLESVVQFSHALANLYESIEDLDQSAKSTRDDQLTQQFIENVKDANLRWELRRRKDEAKERRLHLSPSANWPSRGRMTVIATTNTRRRTKQPEDTNNNLPRKLVP